MSRCGVAVAKPARSERRACGCFTSVFIPGIKPAIYPAALPKLAPHKTNARWLAPWPQLHCRNLRRTRPELAGKPLAAAAKSARSERCTCGSFTSVFTLVIEPAIYPAALPELAPHKTNARRQAMAHNHCHAVTPPQRPRRHKNTADRSHASSPRHNLNINYI